MNCAGEQAKAFLDLPDQLMAGLNLINQQDLCYFQPVHQAELFRLKGLFLQVCSENQKEKGRGGGKTGKRMFKKPLKIGVWHKGLLKQVWPLQRLGCGMCRVVWGPGLCLGPMVAAVALLFTIIIIGV